MHDEDDRIGDGVGSDDFGWLALLGDEFVMRRNVAILGVALMVIALSGCTASDPRPAPSPSAVAPSPSTTGLDPETVFPPTNDVLWQEHPGPGKGPFVNSDPALAVGSYRLDVACRGGGMTIAGENVGETLVTCANGTVTIPVCLTKPGLRVTASWALGTDGDLVWRLRRLTESTCR